MLKKKISYFVLVSILLYSLLGIYAIQLISEFPIADEPYINQPVQFPRLSGVAHDEISIISNENFTTANGIVGGNGTIQNPYLIMGWEFSTGTTGLRIQDTDAHLIIQNNTFHTQIGIFLHNVSNAQILNNSFSDIYAAEAPQTPIIGVPGKSGNSTKGIGLFYAYNITIENNIIDTMKASNGGPAGETTITFPSLPGGSGGSTYGIDINHFDNILIKNNIIHNLTAGNGNVGGKGYDATTTTGNGATGSNGGSAGAVYAIYSSNGENLYIEGNEISELYGATAGTGGDGGAGGSTSGNGGNGGNIYYGYATYGIYSAFVDNAIIIQNSINYLYGGNAGTGGKGGNCVTGTAGDGYSASTKFGGSAQGIRVDYDTNFTISWNNVSNLFGGKGGIGGQQGIYSNSGTDGEDGDGGNGGETLGIHIRDSEEINVHFNIVKSCNGGLAGDGGGDSGTDGSPGYPIGMYLYYITETNFYFNSIEIDICEIMSSDEVVFNNNLFGNYWSAYEGLDNSPKDGVGDTLYYIFDYLNDTKPLMHPFYEDSDGDSLPNWKEFYLYDTNMVDEDSDGDLIPDDWEIAHALDPLNILDGSLDYDGDGLSNYLEFYLGTDIYAQDTDGDGVSDYDEYHNGTDPMTINSISLWQKTKEFFQEYSTMIVVGTFLIGFVFHGFITKPKNSLNKEPITITDSPKSKSEKKKDK